MADWACSRLREHPAAQCIPPRPGGFDLKDKTRWRPDIATLIFPITDHAATCAVQRGRFGALPQQLATALAYFRSRGPETSIDGLSAAGWL